MPVEYQAVEYTERPVGTSYVSGYASTGVMLSGAFPVTVKIGFMPTGKSAPSTGNNYQYPIACKSTTSGNTVGLCINITNTLIDASIFSGTSATISPMNGAEMLNTKIPIVGTLNSDGAYITDGIHEATALFTPRTINVDYLWLFGVKKYNTNQIANEFIGRIYYIEVLENGVEVLNLVPCYRIADSAPGFYDLVNNSFISNALWVVGNAV